MNVQVDEFEDRFIPDEVWDEFFDAAIDDTDCGE